MTAASQVKVTRSIALFNYKLIWLCLQYHGRVEVFEIISRQLFSFNRPSFFQDIFILGRVETSYLVNSIARRRKKIDAVKFAYRPSS